MPGFSFKKAERLSGRDAISELYRSAKPLDVYPLRFLYREISPGIHPAQTAVSVPKKAFRHAVDRNLLKRRMREAYRQNKPEFYRGLNDRATGLHLMVVYRSGEIRDFTTIQRAMEKGLQTILMQLHAGP